MMINKLQGRRKITSIVNNFKNAPLNKSSTISFTSYIYLSSWKKVNRPCNFILVVKEI